MGTDDGYEEHFDDDGFDDELADDDEGGGGNKKRVATSTKIVLVVAGWILLTLFLVGEFSKDKTPTGDTASARLDTVDDGADGDEDELSIDEDEAIEEFDADGDGVLSDTERAAAVEAYEAAVASGEIAIGAPWKGVTGGTATATEEGIGESATPGAGGTSGGSGSGSGSGSGTSGGSSSAASTTTTTAAAGGGSTTTTTTKAGSPATTTPSTTTTPTTTAPPASGGGGAAPVDQTITLSGNAGSGGFSYSPRNFTVPAGSRISMHNASTAAHTWQLGDGPDEALPKGATLGPKVVTETVSYRCTISSHNLSGTITVSKA